MWKAGIWAICPHMNTFYMVDGDSGSERETVLAGDIEMMRRACTHILLLKGWERSQGCLGEAEAAMAAGLRSFTDVDDLIFSIDTIRYKRVVETKKFKPTSEVEDRQKAADSIGSERGLSVRETERSRRGAGYRPYRPDESEVRKVLTTDPSWLKKVMTEAETGHRPAPEIQKSIQRGRASYDKGKLKAAMYKPNAQEHPFGTVEEMVKTIARETPANTNGSFNEPRKAEITIECPPLASVEEALTIIRASTPTVKAAQLKTSKKKKHHKKGKSAKAVVRTSTLKTAVTTGGGVGNGR